MRNKVRLMLIAMLSMFVITGCSSVSPTKVVEAYFSEIKSGENADVEKYLSEAANSAENDSDVEVEEDPKMNEAIAMYLEKLDAKCISENIDGENATVDVEIKGLNFGKIIVEVLQESISNLFSGSQVDDSEISTSFLEKVSTGEVESRTGKVNLSKADKEWKINVDDDLMSLIFGSME